MLDIEINKRKGSSSGLFSRPSQIPSQIRRNAGINHNELKRSSSPASNLRGMSADAAERWSNKPKKPASNLRGMSADAAERWSNSANSRGTYNIRSGDTLSAIAQRELGSSSRWREIKKPDGSSFGTSEAGRLRVGQQISLPGTSRSTNNRTGSGTQNLRVMSADAAERWSKGSRPQPQLAIASQGERNNDNTLNGVSGVVAGIAVGGFLASRRLSPVPTEASRAAKPLVLSATLPGGRNSIREIPLRRVRFSQGDVSPTLRRNNIPLSQVAQEMRKSGWDYTREPPDLVRFQGRNLSIGGRRIPIGRSQYVTLDNRRLVAAREAGIRNIPARIHSENDSIRHNVPSEPGRAGMAEAKRFELKKVKGIEVRYYIDPKTGITHGTGSRPSNWGEAVRHRGASQRVRGHENFPLQGTKRLPEIKPSESRVANTTLRTAGAVGESRAASMVLRGASRVAAPIGVVLDTWRLASAYKKDGFGQEFRETAGSVAGGWGGAAAGAAGGAAIGSVVPVVGTTAGAIVGGVIGGVAGSEFGDDIEQGAEKAGQVIAGGAKKAWNEVFG